MNYLRNSNYTFSLLSGVFGFDLPHKPYVDYISKLIIEQGYHIVLFLLKKIGNINCSKNSTLCNLVLYKIHVIILMQINTSCINGLLIIIIIITIQGMLLI